MRRLARDKAQATATEAPGATILGGRHRCRRGRGDARQAASTCATRAGCCRLLQGRRHHVYTGVALWRLGAIRDAVEVDRSDFSPMTAEEIEWYVASGEPLGKAGAYAIQGLASRFVSRIEGSYSNVVGLPIAVVHRLLAHE